MGLQNGWIPTDPRDSIGKCGGLGASFSGEFQPWQTGGAGAGQVASTFAWPPATIQNAPAAAAQLPTYTPTGTIATLPIPTYTNTANKPITSGNGWFNANDNTPAPTEMAGCPYPNAWDAQAVAVPAGCGVPAVAAAPLETATTATTTVARGPGAGGVATATTATATTDLTATTDVVRR